MRISDWSSDVCSSDLIEQAVEHRRPAHIRDKPQRKPLRFGKAVFGGEDRQAGINQRKETDSQFVSHQVPPSSSCAVTTASAISAIRLFDDIALRRNSP